MKPPREFISAQASADRRSAAPKMGQRVNRPGAALTSAAGGGNRLRGEKFRVKCCFLVREIDFIISTKGKL